MPNVMQKISAGLPDANAICILRTKLNDFVIGYLKQTGLQDMFVLSNTGEMIPTESVNKYSYILDSGGNKTYKK